MSTPGVHNGPIALTVADLDRSLAFYAESIGLATTRTDGSADLGVDGTTLIRLIEEPGAVPSDGDAGLFHLALLLPTRRHLAQWVQHAIDDRVRIEGASDHVVSEALYLTDPDGHGIEIYADRERAIWAGRVQTLMTTLPLDLPSLLEEVDPANPDDTFDGMPAGTTLGHVHLRVSDVEQTVAWYRDIIGLELMATYGAQAAFLAADGYHHHIGANVWQSAGRPVAQPGTARLLHATLVVPDETDLGRLLERARTAGGTPVARDQTWELRDPSGIALRIATA